MPFLLCTNDLLLEKDALSLPLSLSHALLSLCRSFCLHVSASGTPSVFAYCLAISLSLSLRSLLFSVCLLLRQSLSVVNSISLHLSVLFCCCLSQSLPFSLCVILSLPFSLSVSLPGSLYLALRLALPLCLLLRLLSHLNPSKLPGICSKTICIRIVSFSVYIFVCVLYIHYVYYPYGNAYMFTISMIIIYPYQIYKGANGNMVIYICKIYVLNLIPKDRLPPCGIGLVADCPYPHYLPLITGIKRKQFIWLKKQPNRN